MFVVSFCKVRHFLQRTRFKKRFKQSIASLPLISADVGAICAMIVDLRGLQLQSHAVPSHSYLIWSPKIIMDFMFLTLLYFTQKLQNQPERFELGCLDMSRSTSEIVDADVDLRQRLRDCDLHW